MTPSYERNLACSSAPSTVEYRRLCDGYSMNRRSFQKQYKSVELEKRPSFAINNDPFAAHIATLLGHEEKHRGKRGGFSALGEAYLLCSNRKDISSEAFLEVIDSRILRHYKDDEKLLPLLPHLMRFDPVGKRTRLGILSKIIESTSNKEIKAEAYFQWLHFIAGTHSPANRIDFGSKIILPARDKIVKVHAKKIKDLYGNQIRRIHGYETNFQYCKSFFSTSNWESKLSFNPNPKTYGELVDSVLRDSLEIRPGKPFPNLKGKGFDGKEYSLSDQKGKLVILATEGDGTNLSNRETFRMLRKLHKDKGVETMLISSQGNYNSFYSTQSDIQKGIITGIVINDSPTMEISYFLNSYGYRDHYYLINEEGKLLCRCNQMKTIRDKLEEVLLAR